VSGGLCGGLCVKEHEYIHSTKAGNVWWERGRCEGFFCVLLCALWGAVREWGLVLGLCWGMLRALACMGVLYEVVFLVLPGQVHIWCTGHSPSRNTWGSTQ
jgi:hypothetical protein